MDSARVRPIFKVDFERYNIDRLLHFEENGNPENNYEILDRTIHYFKERHYPPRHIKFNKHKHKKNKWITNGIIKSVKFRDKLFIRLKNTPNNSDLYETLKTNLATYNKILKANIKAAKALYFHKMFLKYKKDIKNTLCTIKEIINRTKNKKKLPTFFKINNDLVSDPFKIVSNFNSYFSSIGPNLASEIEIPENLDFKGYLQEPVQLQI